MNLEIGGRVLISRSWTNLLVQATVKSLQGDKVEVCFSGPSLDPEDCMGDATFRVVIAHEEIVEVI